MHYIKGVSKQYGTNFLVWSMVYRKLFFAKLCYVFIRKKIWYRKLKVKFINLRSVNFTFFLLSICRRGNIVHDFLERTFTCSKQQIYGRQIFQSLNGVWNKVADWLININMEILMWSLCFAQKWVDDFAQNWDF